MNKRCLLGVVAAAVITTPLMGLPALGAACGPAIAPTLVTGVAGGTASYTVAGCSVGPVTFSDMVINTTVSPGASVFLSFLNPFTLGDENGLSLSYSAFTGANGGTVDVSWVYNIFGSFLTDAFASLTGGTSGSNASIALDETLSPIGVTLHLDGPGSVTKFFSPIGELGVVKDQFDFAAEGSSARTSVMQNGFSVNVPGPIVGAGFPGLVAACCGLLALARRRRKVA